MLIDEISWFDDTFPLIGLFLLFKLLKIATSCQSVLVVIFNEKFLSMD
jgi:hypothetical protein